MNEGSSSVNEDCDGQAAGGACSGRNDCACAECREHGHVIRLIMDGLRAATREDGTQVLVDSGRQIAFREDGTATAWSNWSETPRRTLIRFKPSRDGGLIPKERGKRRSAVIEELGSLLNDHGVSVTARERPGPESQLPEDEVVAAVEQLRTELGTLDAAYAEVAKVRGFAASYVKRLYLAHRNVLPSVPSQAGPDLEGPRGPDLLEWIKQVQSAGDTSFSAVSREVAEVMGWTPEQLRHQLVGNSGSGSRT